MAGTVKTGTVKAGAVKVAAVKEPVAWLALIGVGIWDLNDATGPKAVPPASLFLGIVAALFLLAVARRHSTKVVLPKTVMLLVGGCFLFGIAMIPLRPDFYAAFIFTDLGALGFFVLCMMVAAAYEGELTSRRTVTWSTRVCTGIAGVARYAAVVNPRPEYRWNGRWDPPFVMLSAALTASGAQLVRLYFRAPQEGGTLAQRPQSARTEGEL